jgi:hypothetical protein
MGTMQWCEVGAMPVRKLEGLAAGDTVFMAWMEGGVAKTESAAITVINRRDGLAYAVGQDPEAPEFSFSMHSGAVLDITMTGRVYADEAAYRAERELADVWVSLRAEVMKSCALRDGITAGHVREAARMLGLRLDRYSKPTTQA